MKKVFSLVFLCVCCIACSLFAQEKLVEETGKKAPVWHEDFELARKISKAEQRPIFVFFAGSDWCIWCVRLNDQVLSKKEFLDYAEEKLVLFKADFPEKIKQPSAVKEQNKKLAKDYSVRGFPTVLIMDKDGKILGRTGYKSGGPVKYVEHIKSFFEKQ